MSTKLWKETHPELMRLYRRRWYANNRERAKRKTKERNKAIRSWLQDLKTTLRCAKPGCGETHIACLEFHHKDPKSKEMSISKAVGYGWSKQRILREIAKCTILCANCRRKLHWVERKH